jgi:hypothetical protein
MTITKALGFAAAALVGGGAGIWLHAQLGSPAGQVGAIACNVGGMAGAITLAAKVLK